jgi:hypothetical protein
MKRKVNQMFSVPKTREGLRFLELADKFLNHDSYILRKRGRKPNHDKINADGIRVSPQSLPLKYANTFGVYPMCKIKKGKKINYLTVGINDAISYEFWRDKYFEEKAEYNEIKQRLHAIKSLAEWGATL